MALSTCLVDELHQPTIFFPAVYILLSITESPDNSLVLVIKSCKRNFFFHQKNIHVAYECFKM